MNESTFTRNVNNKVVTEDRHMLARKIHDSMNSGWPDCEYIPVNKPTHFVEYKLLKRARVPASIKPDLSAQQIIRLKALHANQPGRVMVVVGVMLGANNYRLYTFISPDQWENACSVGALICHESQNDYARWLVSTINLCA